MHIFIFASFVAVVVQFRQDVHNTVQKEFFKNGLGEGGVGELLLRVKRTKKGEGPGVKECKTLLGKKGRIMFCL